MEKEFQIEGIVLLDERITLDQYFDQFIDFIEQQQWFFGGGPNLLNDRNAASIQGCISVEESMTYELFLKYMQLFNERTGCRLTYSIREIIDGYYMNLDGSQGLHVLDETT